MPYCGVVCGDVPCNLLGRGSRVSELNISSLELTFAVRGPRSTIGVCRRFESICHSKGGPPGQRCAGKRFGEKTRWNV